MQLVVCNPENNCDCVELDNCTSEPNYAGTQLFDFSDPSGSYSFDLQNPYARKIPETQYMYSVLLFTGAHCVGVSIPTTNLEFSQIGPNLYRY